MTIDLVMFDLDGVLVSTKDVFTQTVLDVGRAIGVEPMGSVETASHKSPNEACNLLFPTNNNLAKELFPKVWQTNLNLAKVYPGINNLVDHFSSRSIALAVVTSRNSSDATALMRIANLLSKINTLITWGQYKTAKPSPKCIQVALETTGKNPSSSVYIGDQPIDMIAAIRAGVKGIGATWGGTYIHRDLINAGASFVAAQPKDIDDYLTQLS